MTQEDNDLLLYRLAMVQFVTACKDLASASRRLSEAAQKWDHESIKQDAGVIALAETAGQLLLLTASSSPGLASVFSDVVDRVRSAASGVAQGATEVKGDASEAQGEV